MTFPSSLCPLWVRSSSAFVGQRDGGKVSYLAFQYSVTLCHFTCLPRPEPLFLHEMLFINEIIYSLITFLLLKCKPFESQNLLRFPAVAPALH